MNSMKSAFVTAGITQDENNRPADPAAVPVAAATPTCESTLTFTASQLKAILAEAAAQAVESQGTTPAPAGGSTTAEPRHTANPEASATYQFLTRLDQAISRMILGTRDHVVVPANLYLADKATPQVLAVLAAGCLVAASSAGKVNGYFTRLAQHAAAKSLDRSIR
jgi:hypothetical protein